MRSTTSGSYDLSITWPATSGLSDHTRLAIGSRSGSYSRAVNEQPALDPADPWYSLGSYQFNRQTPYNGCRNLHRAQISNINADDGAVAADALRLRQTTRSESGRRVLVRTPEHFTYDADGNLIGDGRRGYGYDAENRLIWAGTSGGYTYDYRGRRSGKGVAGGDQIYCLYDGWNLLAELGVNAPAPYPETWDVYLYRTHVWGLDLSGSLGGAGGIGGLAVTRQYEYEAGNTHYPVYDGAGNVVGLVKAKDGTLSARYEYSPYGELLTSTTGSYAGLANPFRFSTKYSDDESGLIYFGYRYYNPDTGRWINRDPIQEDGGKNLYGFVADNPMDGIDPLGLWKITRANQPLALAISEKNDTPNTLAGKIGYFGSEVRNWLTLVLQPGASPPPTLLTSGGPKTLEKLRAWDTICAGQAVFIPNTILAYWGGEFGDFGKGYTGWYRDLNTLLDRGFAVDEEAGKTAAGFHSLIRGGMGGKSLHGLFLWGHGVKDLDGQYWGYLTDSNHKKDKDNTYISAFDRWPRTYKMGLGILFMCGGYATRDHFGPDAIFWAKEGLLVPIFYPPPVSDIIPAGAQGTKNAR